MDLCITALCGPDDKQHPAQDARNGVGRAGLSTAGGAPMSRRGLWQAGCPAAETKCRQADSNSVSPVTDGLMKLARS